VYLKMLTVLSIAGFDPSGGAGALADIKTFAARRWAVSEPRPSPR